MYTQSESRDHWSCAPCTHKLSRVIHGTCIVYSISYIMMYSTQEKTLYHLYFGILISKYNFRHDVVVLHHSISLMILYVNYSKLKLALVRLVTNWGLSSSVSGQGRPVILQSVGLMTCLWVWVWPQWKRVRICDAPLFQACCEATISRPFF